MKRNLTALVSGAFAHRMAETFYDLTLPLLVLAITGSPLLMSLMFALGYAAEFLVAVFGGALVDRVPRKRLLVSISVLEIVVLSAAGTALSMDALSTVPLFLAAFAIDGLVRLYQVADATAIAWLVPREMLPRANGYMQMALSVAQASGPALCGLSIAMVGLTGSVWITAAAFVPLALMMMLIKWPERNPGQSAKDGTDTSADEDGTEEPGFVRSAIEGVKYTVRTPLFRLVLVWRGVFDFFIGGSYLMFLFYFQRELSLGGLYIGLIMTMGALGGFAGGWAFARLQRSFASGPLMLYCSAVMAALIGLLPHITHWVLLGLVIGLTMFHGAQVYRLSAMLFQVMVPVEMLGRVTATSQMLTTATGPISVLIAGSVALHQGVFWVFTVSCLGVLTLVAVSLRTQLRSADWGVAAAAPPGGDGSGPGLTAADGPDQGPGQGPDRGPASTSAPQDATDNRRTAARTPSSDSPAPARHGS